ncbi:MAG: cytochrome b/b6 domain-containing protein [Cyanobacteriota bacterium]|nr:cytochrome b/b6 domain-containing protein [Cyanobacteriota bacterium]
MPQSRPYQPLLLRILHGLNAAIALLAILTSFWVYNTYDGRLIRLPLPKISGIIGIHGTFGLTFFLFFPLFALYSFHLGSQRLIQPNSLGNAAKLDRKIGWYSWHRILNTLMLIAATLSIVTGRMMQEKWLPAEELDHIWYKLHVAGWVILVISVILHVAMGLKVGGFPLIQSIFARSYRPDDSPRIWWHKFKIMLNRSQ